MPRKKKNTLAGLRKARSGVARVAPVIDHKGEFNLINFIKKIIAKFKRK